MKQIKKMMIYVAFMLIILSTQCTWRVYAQEIQPNISIVKDSQIPLYDNSNCIVAYHFTLNNGGYVITNSDGSDFIKYTLEKQNFILNKNAKYYYSGPCSIYEKENSTMVENFYTHEELKLSSVEFEIEPESNCNNNLYIDGCIYIK